MWAKGTATKTTTTTTTSPMTPSPSPALCHGCSCPHRDCKCWFYWRSMILYSTLWHAVAVQNRYYGRLRYHLVHLAQQSLFTTSCSIINEYDGDDGTDARRSRASLFAGGERDFIDQRTRLLMCIHYVSALAVTVICQLELNTRYTACGRTWKKNTNLIPVTLFSICNGFFETFIFLAWYDYGKSVLVIDPKYHQQGNRNSNTHSSNGGGSGSSIWLGFTFYYVYMAVLATTRIAATYNHVNKIRTRTIVFDISTAAAIP